MVVLSLFIMNKSGGLIYHRNFNSGLQSLSANDYLVLAGTFHGVHAITSLINPVKNTTDAGTRGGPPRGLEVMESEMFRMQCFQTLTGMLLTVLSTLVGLRASQEVTSFARSDF
jgi:trafficking protein particle complex subunit 4